MFGKKCFGGNITLAKTLAIVCILIACLMPVFLYLEADWKALWNVVSVQISPYSVDQMTYSAELCLCVLACIYITDVASAYQLFFPLQYSHSVNIKTAITMKSCGNGERLPWRQGWLRAEEQLPAALAFGLTRIWTFIVQTLWLVSLGDGALMEVGGLWSPFSPDLSTPYTALPKSIVPLNMGPHCHDNLTMH